ncbi:MAG: potassium channel family protein [Gaiellaceae bacterium]|nr:potassium channel family protein [Gaiellaceae bacterium]
METSRTSRLETFSDGVFAIAATLLVLELTVKRGAKAPPLGHQLLHDLWPSYLAYATSFLTIAIIWINHHHVMEIIERVDRTFLFVTALLLLVVAFIPFPTALVAHSLQTHTDERAAVYAYGVTLLLMAVVFNVLWTYARRNRRLLGDELPGSTIRAVTLASGIGIPLTGLVLALASWTPLGGVIYAFSLSAFYLPGVALLFKAS